MQHLLKFQQPDSTRSNGEKEKRKEKEGIYNDQRPPK